MITLTNIKWDKEGQSDVDLPDSVLFIGWDQDSEEISIILSETFGYNHSGYNVENPENPSLELPAILHPSIKL